MLNVIASSIVNRPNDLPKITKNIWAKLHRSLLWPIFIVGDYHGSTRSTQSRTISERGWRFKWKLLINFRNEEEKWEIIIFATHDQQRPMQKLTLNIDQQTAVAIRDWFRSMWKWSFEFEWQKKIEMRRSDSTTSETKPFFGFQKYKIQNRKFRECRCVRDLRLKIICEIYLCLKVWEQKIAFFSNNFLLNNFDTDKGTTKTTKKR